MSIVSVLKETHWIITVVLECRCNSIKVYLQHSNKPQIIFSVRLSFINVSFCLRQNSKISLQKRKKGWIIQGKYWANIQATRTSFMKAVSSTIQYRLKEFLNLKLLLEMRFSIGELVTSKCVNVEGGNPGKVPNTKVKLTRTTLTVFIHTTYTAQEEQFKVVSCGEWKSKTPVHSAKGLMTSPCWAVRRLVVFILLP